MADDWIKVAAAKRKAAATRAREAAQQEDDLRGHAMRVFDQQIGSIWSRMDQRLRTQADAFNAEMGEQHFYVEVHPDHMDIRSTKEPVCAGFDRDQGLRGWIDTGGGLNIRWSLPVSLQIDGDTLQVLYEGQPVSAEELVDRVLKHVLDPPTPPGVVGVPRS